MFFQNQKMKKFLFLFLLIKMSWVSSQTFVVVDSLSKEPLAYANVVLDDKKMLYTNEKGKFSVSDPFEYISISYLSYYELNAAKNTISDTIYLRPLTYTMEPINVSTRKIVKKIGVVKQSKRFKNLSFSGCDELIVFLRPTRADIIDGFIDKVEIPLNKDKSESLYQSVTSIVRINIYTTDAHNLPKDKIYSSAPIRYLPSKDKLITVDLKDEAIQINEIGLCFGLEYIGMIDENGEIRTLLSHLRPVITEETSTDYQAVTYLTNSAFKRKKYFYPINNSFNDIKDSRNTSPQNYNLAISLTISK